MAIYCGNTLCKGTFTAGNAPVEDNQVVRAEFDSEKGNLIFLLDNVHQPIFITGIKEKVRFMIFVYSANSNCTIRSLKKLAASTTGHVENEKALLW
ncbi:MAG: hypothetical protein EZS28_007352 [Streblomastix strix]|uniref:Uncharacterized protein n=1 Tax=Streblomastix strix TaxID=222440 RepID=A0A5J4WQS6_9EUKA|nr:MAG: hypothetical protein EZS28_007352 [Streblomastix strix]